MTLSKLHFETHNTVSKQQFNGVVLLHLSDFHFFPEIEGVENEIVEKIGSYIKDMIESSIIPQIDVVVVSGDLTSQGKSGQFDTFGKGMQILARMIGIPEDKILFACGNHDFDQDTLKNDASIKKEIIKSAQAKDGAKSQIINDAINNPDRNKGSYKTLMEGTQQFYDFSKEYYKKDYFGTHIYRIITFEISNNEEYLVNIALLNSSFVNSGEKTGIGSERGLFSEGQITQVINDLESIRKEFGKKQFNVAVYHHPFNYVYDSEQSLYKDLFKSNFDIGLHGHIHAHESTVVDESFVEVSAGAANAPAQKVIEANLVVVDFDKSEIGLLPLRYVYGSGWEQSNKETHPLREDVNEQKQTLEKITKWIKENPPSLKAIHLGGKQLSESFSLESDEVLLQLYTKYVLKMDGVEQKGEIFDILRELEARHHNSTIILLGQAGAGKSSISSMFFNEQMRESDRVSPFDLRQSTIDIFIDLGKRDASLTILEYLKRFKPHLVKKKVHLFFDSYDEYKTLIEMTTGEIDQVLELLRKISDESDEWQVVLFSLRSNTYDMNRTQIEEVLRERHLVELKEIEIREDKPEEIMNFLEKIFSNARLTMEQSEIERAADSVVKVFSDNEDLPRLPIFIIVIAYIFVARLNLNFFRNGRYSNFLLFLTFAKAIHSLEFKNKKINISFDEYVREFGELAWYRSVSDEYDFFKSFDVSFYDRVLPKDIVDRVHESLNHSELSPFIIRSGGGKIIYYTFSHDNFLRLFISTFIVTILFSKDSTESDIEAVLSIPQRKDVTEFVRDYFNSLISGDDCCPKPDYFLDIEGVLNRLIGLSRSLIGKKSSKQDLFRLNAASLVVYYMGRINFPISKKFLMESYLAQLETVKKVPLEGNASLDSKYELWHLRNIMVSLMKLGETEIEKAYFQRLSGSELEREINLAFHQDYYLDIPVKEWYTNPFQYKNQFPRKTYEYLRRTLIEFVKNPKGCYFNLPYYTMTEVIDRQFTNNEISSFVFISSGK